MCARLSGLLLVLAACSPEFTNPLSPAAGAKVDAALVGRWLEAKPDGTPRRLEVKAREGGVMSFRLVKKNEKDALGFEGHVTALGSMKVLNLKAVEGDLGGDSLLFVRYELAADGTLSAWLLRDSAFGAAVKDGSLKGRLSSGSPSTVIVTDTPENVRAFLQKQKSESLWEPLTTFRKE
jgi:hypothetical protein